LPEKPKLAITTGSRGGTWIGPRMQDSQALNWEQDGMVFQRSVKTQLEVAILWLEDLLDSEERKEARYQDFFEQNPIVFTVLGYKGFHAFTKASGKTLPRDEHKDLEPEPDFIAQRVDGLFEIFEIKTPFWKKLRVDSNRYRERFTAEVSSYISQVITYEQYFTRNPENRRRVKELFDLDIHEDLDIKIVIGQRDHIDKVKVHQKAREYKYKIDIVTYDDILGRLIDEYERAHGEYEDLPGFSLHFEVRFRDYGVTQKKYFLDIGSDTAKNRVSVYLDHNDDVRFEVFDNVCKKHTVEIDTSEAKILEEWVYLVCEFGKAPDGFAMSIAVNGNEKDKRVKNTSIDLAVPLQNMMLGCDSNKQNFGRFDVAELLSYSRMLGFRDKYQLLRYFAQRYGDDLDDVRTYHEFDGHRFMYIVKSGDMVQDVEEFKPVFRTSNPV
jgi:hypothetical protein